MRNPLVVTAICWESRSERRRKLAATWCKNFGLSALTANFWIGKLNGRERAELIEKFHQFFSLKTDRYHLLPLCVACYEKTMLAGFKKEVVDNPPFTIIG